MIKTLLTSALLFSGLISFAQIPSGLVADFNFNIGNSVDAVSPSLIGLNSTSVQHSADRFGNPGASLSLATNADINCGHLSKLQMTTGLTISAWINLNTTTGQQAIAAKWTGSMSQDQFLFYINGNKTGMAIGKPSASAGGYNGTTSLTAGLWYHVVATWDNTGLHQTYVNGVLDINSTSSVFTSINNTATIPLYIGSQNGSSRFFNGKIDDVQIFNRKLTLSEINTLGALTYTVTNNLVSKYTFDNTTVDDEVGNSHAISATPSFTTDRFGVPNHAFNVVANTSKLNFKDSYDNFAAYGAKKVSHSFWVNFNQVNSAYQMILSKSADAGCTQDDREFLLRINPNNKLEITSYGTLSAGSYITAQGQSTLSANQWYHIVLTYDAAITANSGIDKYSIFLNSIEESLTITANLGSGVGSGMLNGNACLGVGHQLKADGANCSSTQSLNGKFDDYFVYNTVITQTVIDSLYNITNNPTGLNVNKSSQASLQVFPNPVKNTLFFSKTVIETSVYDVSGKLLLSKENTNSIDLSELSNGVYIISFKDDKGQKYFKKVIKN